MAVKTAMLPLITRLPKVVLSAIETNTKRLT